MVLELAELLSLVELLEAGWEGVAATAARARARLRHHYLVERELADRLRRAPTAERLKLYREVYSELFRRVPDHPQLTARHDSAAHERRQRSVDWHLALLARALGPRTVFMELGAGDCALALRVASRVSRVYALEVAPEVARRARAANLERVLSDGVSVPVPAGSVHVAFSDQLMEHLHPDDAAAQLAAVHRSLAPGGSYFCITPNRMYGPRDISSHFDDTARGLHLKEYCAGELRRLLLQTGFRRVRFYSGARGAYVRMPYALLRGAEKLLCAVPARARRRIAAIAPLRAFFGLYVEAIK
jgi:SAM-dependent methyltransferase